jgi:hypothetical protein
MAARRNNTTPAAGKAKARKARRAELKDAFVDYVRAEAGRLGIAGRSGMTKADLINAILRAEFDGVKAGDKAQAKIKQIQEKAEQKLENELMLVKQKYEKKAEDTKESRARRRKKFERLLQRGPFRLLLMKDDNDGTGIRFVGNLGPYVAGRGAQVDAKTLLRRMFGKELRLDNAGARAALETTASNFVESIEAGMPGSKIADVWFARHRKGSGHDPNRAMGAAFVVSVRPGETSREQALAPGQAEEDVNALRNPRRRGAGRGGQGGRSNPRVSFQTRQGPVSFNTRSNGARGNSSASRLTVLPSGVEPGTYNYFQWTPEKPGSYNKGPVAAIYGVPYPALSFEEALAVAAQAGLYKTTYRNARLDEIALINERATQSALARKGERERMYADIARRGTPVQYKAEKFFDERREKAREAVRGMGLRANGSTIDTTAAQDREVDALYAEGRPYVERLTDREPSAFIYWQDVLLYAVGNGMNADRFLRAVQGGDRDGLFVDDRAKGKTVRASAARKVTWADFTKAIRALQRAMG